MTVRMIGVKLDPDRDRFVRDTAAKEWRYVTDVVKSAIDIYRAYVLIERRVTDSLHRNVVKFGPDGKAFLAWCSEQKKIAGSTSATIDSDTFIRRRTFKHLEEWQKREGEERERYLLDHVYITEYWLHPDAIGDQNLFFIPFDKPAKATA